jgi:hypothetical protein
LFSLESFFRKNGGGGIYFLDEKAYISKVNKETGDSKMAIDFITADNGSIEMFANNELVATASTAKDISWALKEYGFEGSVATSSTIDFADEFGFENQDDAITLWEEGVKHFYMTQA